VLEGFLDSLPHWARIGGSGSAGRGEVGEVKRWDRECTCAIVIREITKCFAISLVLAIAAALMLPSATFGKGGGPRAGYHRRAVS
jgi:hypothetical protein